MMKTKLTLIACLMALYVHAQKKLTGRYEGTFWENKAVLSLKVAGEAVAGALYTGRSTKYSLLGTCQNEQLSATIQHPTFGGGEVVGVFSNDSIIANAVFEKITIPLKLKRKSKHTDIDFDAYFGKPALDMRLVGYWKILYKYNRKNEPSKPFEKGFLFEKNGHFQIDEIIKTNFRNADVSWYTSDNNLYFEFHAKADSFEMNMGKYSIKNDTLFMVGVGQFEGVRSAYLKSK